jgi:thiamine monophosphate synthase
MDVQGVPVSPNAKRELGTGNREADLSLYLVVGPNDTLGRPLAQVVLAAVEGGATAVQLRCKDHPLAPSWRRRERSSPSCGRGEYRSS